ncbi:MAG: hypothetical protein LBC80_06995 [Treponema sp.]|jgi:phage shock protein A|nr:hypothetical protein [Treponema sp.]
MKKTNAIITIISIIVAVLFVCLFMLSKTGNTDDSEIITQLEAEKTRLQAAVVRLEAEKNEMQSTINAFTAGDSAHARVLAERDARITSLLEETRELQNESGNLSSQVTRLRTDNTNQERQIADLNNQLTVIRQLLRE